MRLYFKELGAGEPLILLHGLFGSSDNWLGVAPALAERFHLFIPDLRNHGQSPHSAEMNHLIMTADLVEFFEVHRLAEVCVLGHSLGGKVAMELALRYPVFVKKLVVVDMSPRAYKPIHEEIFSALLTMDLKSFQSRQQVEKELAAKIPDPVIRRFLLKNLKYDSDGALHWRINLHGLADNYRCLIQAQNSTTPFRGPVLFLRGGTSDHITDADGEKIVELFPQAEIQTLPEAGHWVHADMPKKFVQQVLKFLHPV